MWRISSRALTKVAMVKSRPPVKPGSVLDFVRTLSQQKGLPKLPVPPLQQTCGLYLDFLEPILEKDELQTTKGLVEEFQRAGGDGERLQTQLEGLAQISENYMSEFFVKNRHLICRDPLVVYKHMGIVLPQMDIKDKRGQIRCAAELIATTLHVKAMIDSGTLQDRDSRGRPLCMKQYEELMSSCQIPGPEKDSVEFFDNKHITVVHNCQFFVLDVFNSDGTPLTVDQLCVQLETICNSSLQTSTEPVGILTTGHRDTWNETYSKLIRDNKESVSAIQSSIFTVCLDGPKPATDCATAVRQILHGGGSSWNSGNRWCDKGLQVIVGEDGTCGVNVAHVTADGTVAVGLGDHLVENMKKLQVVNSTAAQSPMEPLPVPQKLLFNITPEIRKDIEEAKQHMDKLTGDLDLRVLTFHHFGKNILKALKVSPDAFVHMALQLAYYRIYQQIDRPMMEPVSVRRFKLGRLTFVNTISRASATFVKAFDDPSKQNSEKVDLLEKALKAHRWYLDLASRGQGSETHLWCLMALAIEENISMPPIFTDPAIFKSVDYSLWGSQISSKNRCLSSTGTDSTRLFEMIYGITDHYIHLNLSNFEVPNSSTESHTAHLLRTVEASLLDLKTLLEEVRVQL